MQQPIKKGKTLRRASEKKKNVGAQGKIAPSFLLISWVAGKRLACIASVILANECAIFDLHGSGRLGRGRNLYQAGERRNSKSDMAG